MQPKGYAICTGGGQARGACPPPPTFFCEVSAAVSYPEDNPRNPPVPGGPSTPLLYGSGPQSLYLRTTLATRSSTRANTLERLTVTPD